MTPIQIAPTFAGTTSTTGITSAPQIKISITISMQIMCKAQQNFTVEFVTSSVLQVEGMTVGTQHSLHYPECMCDEIDCEWTM